MKSHQAGGKNLKKKKRRRRQTHLDLAISSSDMKRRLTIIKSSSVIKASSRIFVQQSPHSLNITELKRNKKGLLISWPATQPLTHLFNFSQLARDGLRRGDACSSGKNIYE